MDKYDYREALKADIREWIDENFSEETLKEELTNNREGFQDILEERMRNSDSVTGNASGSYYCSTWKAQEALCHNWDLLENALREFDYYDANILEKGAEWCDVSIRYYLLGTVLSEVLNEYKKDYDNKTN